LHRARIANLVDLLRRILPELPVDSDQIVPWCGLRPVCADGVPVIGPTAVPNLLVNTGHGHLGWTLAAGSGKLLADLLSKRPSSLPAEPFSVERFSAS
jgi:D-amino-acid dehydrogenase